MDLFIALTFVVIFQSVTLGDADGWTILGIILETCFVVCLAFAVAGMVAFWKIFQKAGEQGWKSLIPIYNLYILFLISDCPVYMLLFFIVPILNVYALFRICIGLALSFGKEVGFGVGIVFFPVLFPLILAFGKASYQGRTLLDESSENSGIEGFSASNQDAASQKPTPKRQPKPEDPWVTGKE